MCFQSKLSKKAAIIESQMKATFVDVKAYQPTRLYNGFTFPKTPVILNSNPELIEMVNWGLIPSWSNEKDIRKYTLNARVETLDEKPSFKNVVGNRCLVLCDGFYEWQHVGKEKYKYEIGWNDSLFAFAGLYDQNDEQITYTIVTTEAVGVMREIHNTKLRMPYTLTNENAMTDWLAGNFPKPFHDFTTIPNLGHQLSMFT